MSKSAKVSHAWNTSCAISAPMNGASNGNGRFVSSRKDHSGRRSCFFNRRFVSSASAPVISARSSSPRRMAPAVALTSCCGVVPPMPE
jgi:hypothetical protein